MEFIISRENFYKALSSVENIVKKKMNFSPHLANVLLEAKTDKIAIKATNGEMSQITGLEGKVISSGTISVPYSRLSNLLRQIPSGDLSFVLQENNILKIEPINSKRKFNIEILGISSDNFLEIPSFPVEGKSIVLDKIYFKKMIQKVVFATGAEPTRYAIHAVLLELMEKNITLVATDTRKMALFQTSFLEVNDINESLLLPQELLIHLQKLFNTEGPVSVVMAKNLIFFKFEEYQISSTLVNGEFPKYKTFIPQVKEYSFTANVSELIKALELSSAVYDDSPISKIVFFLKSGELRLFSKEKDYNQVNETIPIIYQGDEFVVGFNVRMILEILKQIETENVEIYFNGEISPFIIKEYNKKDITYIVMPIKLSQEAY